MSACLEDNDPLPFALGAAVKAILVVGGWQSKTVIAGIARALGHYQMAETIMKAERLFWGQQPITDLLSAITMAGKHGRSAAWRGLRAAGGRVAQVLGPVQVSYGLFLAAIEVHCCAYCTTAAWYGRGYDSATGNVVNAWKDYYFRQWL